MDRNSESPQPPSFRPQDRWAKIALYAGLLLLVGWLYLSSVSNSDHQNHDRGSVPTDRGSRSTSDNSTPSRKQKGRASEDRENNNPEKSQSPPKNDDRETGKPLVVRDVRVTNEDDDVVYRGDVDVVTTLQRIESGKRLRYSHDGITFENRERRLPRKPSGYYHEFIHPTPGVEGPGGQRVVLGRDGEVYYTPDHYRTFRRVR